MFLKSPLKAYLWITDTCNLSCAYCYAAPFSEKVMTSSRMHSLIEELSELEVIDLILGGGEPFLHPDIFECIHNSVERGFRVGVITNGVLLTDMYRKRLKEMALNEKQFLIQITLDSHLPEIHDKTRGQGKVVLENIKNLANDGLNVQVSAVITKYNIDSAHQIIDELYPVVKRFNFLEVQKTEKTLARPELIVTKEESDFFWETLETYKTAYPSDLHLPSLRINNRRKATHGVLRDQINSQNATLKSQSCLAGHTMAHIDVDFNVFGCSIAKDYTKMGNILDSSFQDVWNSALAKNMRDVSFPPCYKIKDPAGNSLHDCLKHEFQSYP